MSFFKNPRVIILIACIILSLIAIHPLFDDTGVAIRFVEKNSSAALAGIQNPQAGIAPTSREVIFSMNGQTITDEKAYSEFVDELQAGDEVAIRTNKNTYFLTVKPVYKYTETNETEFVEVNETVVNETTNTTEIISNLKERPIIEQTIIGHEDIGITVFNRPTNNIRKGLDLEGGTRVLLEPEREVSSDELELVMSNIKERLNVYGVSDVIVRDTKDFSGNTYISVEIAGVNKDEVRELLAKQGKFEAKVGNATVFLGGNDIAYVCRTSDCSGIDPNRGCGQGAEGEWFCSFRFQITLTPDAAARQADATRNLEVQVNPDGSSYLSKNLTLYLDNKLVDQLRIASDLRGSAVTDISISGGGNGLSESEAAQNTLANMKRLQTVLISGSLPVKLDIVKTDAISPALGQTFVKNVFLIGILSIISVALVVFIRYREWKISASMILTMISEVIILLGVASLIGWRLDLAAIAGIIIAVGTGVDDQIVIASETIHKKKEMLSWADKLKRAFFIIMAAYFTTVVAMIPLWFAGAGLLKGFALTTILGVSIGVFITRPAFAAIVERAFK